MTREDQRSVANGLAIIFLLLLPLMVGGHLYKMHTALESVYFDFFASVYGRDLPAAFNTASVSLRELVESEATGSLQETTGIAVIPAIDFPDESKKSSMAWANCRDFSSYGARLISYDCASFVISGPVSGGSSVPTVAVAPVVQLVASELRRLFEENSQKRDGSTNAALQGHARDALLFVYSVVPLGGGASAAVFYPATNFDKNYDFTKRQWYTNRKKIGAFYITEIYRDYATNNHIVSISRRESSASGQIHLVADIVVPYPAPIFGLYALNTLIMAIAFFTYWRFYITRRLKFQFYLILSTLCLLGSYVALTLNEILERFGQSFISNERIISSVLPFVPSGALLIAAAAALFPGQRYKTGTIFGISYLAEFTLAVAAVATGQRVFSVLFGCVALCVFGAGVWGRAKAEPSQDRYKSTYVPRNLSVYTALAYWLWGFAQFTLMLEEFDHPFVRTLSAPLIYFIERADLFFTRPVIFLVLLYAKAIAVYTTALYLSWEFELSYRRRLEVSKDVMFLSVTSSGLIQEGNNLSPDSGIKVESNIADYLVDEEDQQELLEYLESNLSTDSYLCRMRNYYPDRIIKISVDRSHYAESARTVTLQPLDETAIYRHFSSLFSSELDDLLNAVSANDSRVPPLPIPLHGELQNSDTDPRLLDVEFRTLLLQRLKTEIVLAGLKIDTQHAWRVLLQKIEACRFYDQIEVRPSIPDFRLLPERLRINKDIWVIVLDLVLHALERHLPSARPIVVDLNLVETRQFDISSNFTGVLFVVRLPLSTKLLRSYQRAIAADGLKGAPRAPKSTAHFQDACFFLRVFGGSLVVSEIDNENLLEVRFYLASLLSK